MWKYKRVIAIAIAILFLTVLFFLKNNASEENPLNNEVGLNYVGEETLEELVVKDMDSDGIADWEESLWGMDSKNADSDQDGVPDAKEVAELKSEAGGNEVVQEENLNETDKFAREFFSSVTTLNEAGVMNVNMAEQLGQALAGEIASKQQEKVFELSQIKVISDNSKVAMQTYNAAAGVVLLGKYPLNEEVIKIISDSFSDDEDMIDENLKKLSGTALKVQKIIDGLLKVSVPSDLATLHLQFINNLEQLKENLVAMSSADNPVLAISAIVSYQPTIETVQMTLEKIAFMINVKKGS